MGNGVPALAVIDSANVRGQTKRVLGVACRPTVSGTVQALADYGFDVRAVHVAVAEPDSDALKQSRAEYKAGRVPIDKAPIFKKANRLFAEAISAEGGVVLRGDLRWEPASKILQEKQIDVACAVDVVRHAYEIAAGTSDYRAIVVVSDDVDLLPAVSLAVEKGVPCYIAGVEEKISKRKLGPGGGDAPWLLLNERSLTAMCSPSAVVGRDLRMRIANAVLQRSGPLDWDGSGRVELSPGLRMPALFDGETAGPGAKVFVRGAAVSTNKAFPTLECATEKPFRRNFLMGEVCEVKTVFDATIKVISWQNKPVWKVKIPVGQLSSGDRVVLDPRSKLVIGPVAKLREDSRHPGQPILLRVVEVIGRNEARAVSVADEEWILRSTSEPVALDRTYAALVVDSPRGERKVPLARAVSSPLPAGK